MIIKFYTFCLLLYICEGATKIGLGNGRPSEEPSSLKTEIMKFKTSECGGSSSEEQSHHSKKKQKHRKKDSEEDDEDDDEDDEDSEEKNNKKKKSKNNRRGQKNNHGYREDFGMGYTSTSYEHNRNFGMDRNPPDDYMNRRQGQGSNSFQGGWNEDPINNPYAPNPRNRNQYNPYGQNQNHEGFYPQNNNRRNPYGPQQDNYNNNNNNRGRYPYQDDRYNNRDDRNFNRRKPYNNWDESSENDDNDNYSRGNRKKNNQRRRGNNRDRGKRNKNKNNKDDSAENECVSQCVFNNMEIMEDDGIPSEAGMIKWAQGKIKNEKLKQSAVKEIRKCFGQLATSDGENSCNFSKSLSGCLKLELDDDND